MMANKDVTVEAANPQALGRLLELAADNPHVWQPDELKAILRYQLCAPMEINLGGLSPEFAPKLTTLMKSQGLLLRNLTDLFQHSYPPIEVLRLVKDYAKRCRNHQRSELPQELATILYLASIAVALVRCEERITELEDCVLHNGFTWGLGQPWIDDNTRALFEQARAGLASEADTET